MTHKNFRTLSDPIVADPVRRARIEEMGRAMDLVMAIAKLCHARYEVQGELPTAPDGAPTGAPHIRDEDSLFLSTLKEGVEELGGRLEVAVIFRDRTVQLLG